MNEVISAFMRLLIVYIVILILVELNFNLGEQKESNVNVLYLSGKVDHNMAATVDNFLISRNGKNVLIRIKSMGGSGNAMHKIIRDMNAHNGKIYVKLEGGCYSACAVIASYADTVLANSDTEVMFHMPRYDGFNKKPVIIHIEHPDAGIRREARKTIAFYDRHVKYLLTKDEYGAMIRGKDIFINGAVFKKRHDNLMRRIQNV